MSMRKKFFNAMRRKDGSYIPFEFELCPSLEEEFTRRTGKENYPDYYGFPVRRLIVKYKGSFDKFHKYYSDLSKIELVDWGYGFEKGSTAHFAKYVHPLKDADSLAEFEEYPFPDPVNDFDWEDFNTTVKSVKDRDLIAVARMGATIFEMAWYIRGLEEFLVDMAINEEMARYLIDRIMDIRYEMAKRYVLSGCDVLWLGDDVSTQLDMMMNPDTWREFIKPKLAQIIKTAKDLNPDILIFYHGDGNLQKIIPDLIEIGLDILNPVQPECMDPFEIKKKYGDKLSFWGTVGTQTTMPFGTQEDVKNLCLRLFKEVGKGGGLLLCPSHMLEPEVPWTNIEAFMEAVNEYNQLNEKL